jgi:peptide/nickel transport system substrate-binding protein
MVLVLLFILPSVPGVQARMHTQATPKYGGSISIRNIFQTNCLNPLDPTSGSAMLPTLDPLVAVDQQGHFRPDLALKWAFGHGGRWITLQLRQGVRFNNGDPFNAKALKAQFDYELKQPAGLAPLERVQVTGPYTIRLVYSAPFRPAMNALYSFDAVDVRAQLALGSKICDQSIGTGAFKIQSIGPGFNTVTLVRNPYHTWGSSWLHNRGKAYLSSMTIKTVVDDTQTASDILSGDLDIARVAPAQLPRLQGQSGISLHKIPDFNVLFLGFNHAHAPFTSAAVRRAIGEAIDQKGLIKAAYGGYGIVQSSIVPRADPAYDPSSPTTYPKYNPAEAARVLKANHVTGPFTLETYTIPVFADTAQFIQAELANVGVKVNLAIKAVPDAQADMSKGQMDMFVGLSGGDDLYTEFDSHEGPDAGGGNFNFLHDTRLDHLLVQSREIVSPRKAQPVLNALQRYMNQQGIVVPLFSRELIAATRSHVQGYRYVPGSNTLMWPAFEDLYLK